MFATVSSLQRHAIKKRKCNKKAVAERKNERTETNRLRARLRYTRLKHGLSEEEFEGFFEDMSKLPVARDAIDLT
jgi:hypothetical protein